MIEDDVMDILLIQPKVGEYDFANIRLPLGILSIAALPEKNGYKVKIIDQRTDKNWDKELLKSLKSNPICVGITSMTGKQIRFALEASKIVKNNSDVPIVWGGVHPSFLPEQTLSNENVDILVHGEGEITFFELVQTLEKEKPLKEIDGIWYKHDKKIKNNKPRPFVDLNKLPDLPYHLIDMKKYCAFDISGRREYSISFALSRGCPFKCAFCYNTVFNKKRWRGLSIKNAMNRIKKIIDDFDIKSFYFIDDNICANPKWFKELIKNFLKEKFDFLWGTQGIRIDSVVWMDHNLLTSMEKSGCRNLDFGIESGSPRILDLMKKDITIPQVKKVAKKLLDFPFILKYNFMSGFPTETMEDIDASIKLALKLVKENKNAYILYHTYTPFPGTELYELAIEHGFDPPKTLEGWSVFNYIDWPLNYPSWLSKEKIELLNNLSFISRFANKNLKYKITRTTMRLIFNLYYPIAEFRFKHSFYNFFFEKTIAKHISSEFI